MLTGSPTRLNHRPTDNFAAPAIVGTFIAVPISSLISSPSARVRPAGGRSIILLLQNKPEGEDQGSDDADQHPWIFGPFHFFARSTRTSRNSGGPFVRRRRRSSRSSGRASGSAILSIAAAANSAAREERATLAAGSILAIIPKSRDRPPRLIRSLEIGFAFRPISTRRRMASGRERSGACF